MTPRARDLLNRSRALLGGSRDGVAPPQSKAEQPPDPPSPSTPPASGVDTPADGSPTRARTRPGIPPATPQPRRQPPALTPGSLSAAARIPAASRRLTAGRGSAQPIAATSASEALSAICGDIALRDLNLVDLLLSQLEEMEAAEDDADRLAELYRLDHFAARLRRNAENLRVLAGHDAGSGSPESTALVDVVRAAMSSIDQYPRVLIGKVVGLGVIGFAAQDVGRVLAELLDNATRSSSPTTPVRVGVHLTETGSALLRVEDEGIGLPPDRLTQLNARLTGEPVLDDDAVRHMGLAVVHRLAARHGLRVWLDSRQPHGTTASVLIPSALICELPEGNWSGAQTVRPQTESDTDGDGYGVDAEAAIGHPPALHSGAFRGSSRTRASTEQAPRVGNGRPTAALFGGSVAPPVGAQAAGAAPVLVPVPAPLTGPPSADALTDGKTATGLPRRLSRSLRTPANGDTSTPDSARAGDARASDAQATEAPEGDARAAGTTAAEASVEAAAASEPESAAITADTGSDPAKAGMDDARPGDTVVDGADADQASPVAPATPVSGPAGATRTAGAADLPGTTSITGTTVANAGAVGTDGGAGDHRNGHSGQSASALKERRAADHAKLLADLDAFAEGEQTAHRHQRGD